MVETRPGSRLADHLLAFGFLALERKLDFGTSRHLRPVTVHSIKLLIEQKLPLYVEHP
jgi:hypothetical protein